MPSLNTIIIQIRYKKQDKPPARSRAIKTLRGLDALLYFQIRGKVRAGVRNTPYQSIFATVSNFLNHVFLNIAPEAVSFSVPEVR